jgi:DNA repair protein RecN (Recombination protein N)
MLRRVSIRSFSLLRSIELHLEPGLTCITGESGAGKSLLFDAIAFACGGRTHRAMLAAGSESCEVTLMLDVSNTRAKAAGNPWQEGSNQVVRRFTASGRSNLTVNGSAARVNDVQTALADLIEVTGQFESTTLFNPAAHLALLDSFGGPALVQARESYAAAYREYRDQADKLAALQTSAEARAQELSVLEYQVAELDKAAVVIGERADVEARLRLQQHSAAVIAAAHSAAELLWSGDDSAYDRAASAQAELRRVQSLLGNGTEGQDALTDVLAGLETALDQLQSVGRLCSDLEASVSADPAAQEQLSTRLDLILQLERKYGVAADDLPALLSTKRHRLDLLSDAGMSTEQVKEQLDRAYDRVVMQGEKLTKLRIQAAAAMRKDAAVYFKRLDFPRCELQVDIAPDNPGPTGIDRAELLITLNPGEPPRPLAQVASGGEASRLLLGLKAALADKSDLQVLLLDEIEAGLGGKTAQKVAEVLSHLARGRQVLAITHLPAVAARAAQHLVVEKSTSKSRTDITIRPLSDLERRSELARMLGGMGTAEELTVVEQLLQAARV